MSLTLSILAAAALAQAPSEPPESEPPGSEPTASEPSASEPTASTDPRTGMSIMEITVWGRLAIDQAEDDIVQAMERLGYSVNRQGDRIVFRPSRAWRGAAIFEDGALTFRRPIAGIAPRPDPVFAYDPRRQTTAIDPSGRASGLYDPGPSFWVLPSRKKLDTVRTAVREELADELAWYQAVVARTAVEEQVAALPDQLDAVWNDGTPLYGVGPLATPKERRRHVLEFWASRAATPEGQFVCRAVAAWLDATVQTSDHPITDEERETYESRRADVLRLP